MKRLLLLPLLVLSGLMPVAATAPAAAAGSPTEGVVTADFVAEAPMKADLLQMLARFATYMKNDFQEAVEPNSAGEACGCFRGENTMGADERGVRPNADLSMICAFLVKYGKGRVDLPHGVSWADLETMAMKSLVFAYSTHKANRLKPCAGNRYWGSTSARDYVWESSLWAMSVAYSAFFQWERLSAVQRDYIGRLLKAECRYELERTIPTGYAGDTKAEENGWEACVLAATLGLFPDDELAPQWFQRLREFAVNSYSQKDDAEDHTVIDPDYDQTTVAQLYKGQNLYDDYTLQNHNYFHTSYQNVVIQELGEAALALKLFQQGLHGHERWKTNALMHNNDKVMSEVLYPLALADGELAMPNGNDWSLFLYDQITSYTTNACFLRDPDALMLENLAYKMIKARQTTTPDGSWLLRPDVGARRMGVEAHRVMMTWLMHDVLSTATLAPTRWADFNRRHGQARLFASQNIVRAATDSRFVCFSWSKGLRSYTGYIAANSADKNKIIVPFKANNTGNFLGWYEVEGRRTNATPVAEGRYQLSGNSFVMDGELLTNDGALDHRFAIYATPGNAVVYQDYVVAADSCTIVRSKGGLMAISTDELTATRRTLSSQQGTVQADGTRLERLATSWVNVDGELGIVASGPTMAFGERANNNSVLTSKLYTLYDDQPRQVAKGDVADRRHAVYYSGTGVPVTRWLADALVAVAPDAGWQGVLAFDPDTTAYLLLSNFDGAERCTLHNLATPLGAPVLPVTTIVTKQGASAVVEAPVGTSVAAMVRLFVEGADVQAVQADGDPATIFVLNKRGKQAELRVSSASVSRQFRLRKHQAAKVWLENGRLFMSELDAFPQAGQRQQVKY